MTKVFCFVANSKLFLLPAGGRRGTLVLQLSPVQHIISPCIKNQPLLALKNSPSAAYIAFLFSEMINSNMHKINRVYSTTTIAHNTISALHKVLPMRALFRSGFVLLLGTW